MRSKKQEVYLQTPIHCLFLFSEFPFWDWAGLIYLYNARQPETAETKDTPCTATSTIYAPPYTLVLSEQAGNSLDISARWLIRHRSTPQRTFMLLFEGMGDAAVLLVGQG